MSDPVNLIAQPSNIGLLLGHLDAKSLAYRLATAYATDPRAAALTAVLKDRISEIMKSYDHAENPSS
jgi:hypothetical protein